MKTIRDVVLPIAIALLLVGLVVWLLIPSHISGELKAKLWKRTVLVQKLGVARETTSYFSAASGVIIKRWTESHYRSHLNSDGELEWRWEDETHYLYRPWEDVARFTSDNTQGERPFNPNTLAYPGTTEWRRRYSEGYWWMVGDVLITIKDQATWDKWSVGQVIDVTHRYGRHLESQLHDAEVLEFDF